MKFLMNLQKLQPTGVVLSGYEEKGPVHGFKCRKMKIKALIKLQDSHPTE